MKILNLCLFLLLVIPQFAIGQNSVDNSKLPPSASEWEIRARQTADDCKLARKAIIAALSVSKLEKLAIAYERLYQAKPISDVRLANYAHAAILSEKFRDTFNDTTYKPCFDRAVEVLASAIEPEEERQRRIHNSHLGHGQYSDAEYYKPVRKQTHNADAWLAWGIYGSRFRGFKTASLALRQAIKIDPTLAEAYIWQADLAVNPYSKQYFTEHKVESRQLLDQAEKMDTSLQPLTLNTRGFLFCLEGTSHRNILQARQMFQKYVTLWPKCPDADAIRKLIVQIDNDLANNKFH